MRNLRLMLPLSFINMLFFPIVGWLFYFLQYLNYQQIAQIMGIGVIFSLVMEIPTGVFADMVGRKWAVFLSYVFFTIAMVGTMLSTTYLTFLIVTLLNSLVNSLYSGSMEALLYDTLKQEKRETEFDVWTSRMDAISWIGLFVSSVVGGYMYSVNPKLPYLAQTVATAIGAIIVLWLVEPKLDSIKYKMGDIWKNNLLGFKELFRNAKLRYLTSIFVVIGLGYYIASDILGLSQLRQYGLEASLAGWVFGVGFVISATMAHFYPTLRKKLGEMRLVWISTTALLISFVFARFVGVATGVGLVMLRIASSTTFRNSRSVIMNREIASRNRATTLSTLNLLQMLPYGLSAGLIGGYIDRTSPNQMAWVMGIVM
ncbi:MFS transporter, partial [Candidatus Woesebacteria bacterium]|nr:MFS transporter [Candidatus Woesebacteria bacterium]